MYRRPLLAGGLALAALRPARADARQVRLSHGYGIHYLPLMVIRDRKLLEKHAERMGLGALDVSWRTLDGGNTINDALISGALDIAGIGAPGFIILWAKARNIPAAAVTGVCALGDGALWLNTNKDSIRTLRDFSAADKIAVPGIKTSFAAVVLQMAAAKEFGPDNYAKLDPLTVSMPHPEALTALVSRRTEVTGHVASPPFSNQEVTYPGVHRVFSTLDFLGPVTIDVVMAAKRFADANPRIMDAFLAAKDEADQLIASDKAAASEIFSRTSVNVAPDVISLMLNDPETVFRAAPDGVMKYAEFLAHTGTVRNGPAVWTDLFIPQMHGRAGS